jgi:hypothetical protein
VFSGSLYSAIGRSYLNCWAIPKVLWHLGQDAALTNFLKHAI